MQIIFLRSITMEFLIILCCLVVACSGNSGSVATNSPTITNGSASDLVFITPQSVLQANNTPTTAYILVENPTNETISNITYTLTNMVGSANSLSLNNSEPRCTTIAANSQCLLQVNIPISNGIGSFSISANNAVAESNTKIAPGKKSSTSNNTSSSSLAIAIGQTISNTTLGGANGITLSYYNTVEAGTNFVIISGIVSSNNPGAYNNIVLVNNQGTPLPDQQILSSNLGNNYTNLSEGTSFSILLPNATVTNATQTQSFKIQTSELNNNVLSNIQTGSSNYTLTTSGESQALLYILPNDLTLNSTNLSQIVTISNIGNLSANINSFTSNNSNVTITPPSTNTLAPGSMITATLSLQNSTGISMTSNATLNYSTNESLAFTSVIVDQQLIPHRTPTAGLTAKFSPNSNFSITTADSSTTHYLMLSNTGNTTESDFTLTGLPTGFTLGNGISTNPCILSGNTVTNQLTTSGVTNSCDVAVTFSSDIETPLSNGALSISYDYNSSQIAPLITANFSYQVQIATANLNIGSSNTILDILNNGESTASSIFTITNTSNVTATNVSLSLLQTSNLFAIESNNCSTTLAADESCSLYLVFGPTTLTAGIESSDFTVTYTQYSDGPVANASKALIGNILSAQSATVSIIQTSSNGFTAGNGTLATPYQTQESSQASITYSINNSGITPATNFYITNSLSQPWSISSNSCGTLSSTIILNPGNSCSITFVINSSSVGAENLNLSNITATWNDQEHTDNPNSKIFNGIAYVSVYAPTIITINTSGLSSSKTINQNNSFFVNIALSGGYNVTSQLISLNLTPSSESITFVGNPCSVSSQNTSCTITVHVGTAATESYVINISNLTTGNISPMPNSILFSVFQTTRIIGTYKDVGTSMDWYNTNPILTLVMSTFVNSGNSDDLVPMVTVIPPGLQEVRWAFATGDCSNENWAGIQAESFAVPNVNSFSTANVPYTLSTGGAAGSFTCSAGEDMKSFLDRYNSNSLIGIDFDIEGGRLESTQINSLVNSIAYVKNNYASYANLKVSFTLATLAAGNGLTIQTALDGNNVMNAIAQSGLQDYYINLMVMDYTGSGEANDSVCVTVNNLCEMGQSAIRAATNFAESYSIPLNRVQITPLLGVNDTPDEIFTIADAAMIADFASSAGLGGIYYWSFDRDIGCSPYSDNLTTTCNGIESATSFQFESTFYNTP